MRANAQLLPYPVQIVVTPSTVVTVAGRTGDVVLTKTDVGLSDVDNTSDLDKPVSTATTTALDDKVDKVTGKGLSTEDYTTIEKAVVAATSGTNTGDQDLSGKLDTSATTYALLAGRSGGQVLKGGSAVTDVLKIQGTSGNGTATSPAIQALVGNDGATVAYTVLNNGNVGIGTTNPGFPLQIQKDNIGTTYTSAGLAIVNSTAATSGQSQAVSLKLSGQGWNTASQQMDWLITGDPSTNNNPNFIVKVQKNGGGYSNILHIDSYGQFGTALKFNTYDTREVLTLGRQLGNDAPATASYDQYTPYDYWRSNGWKTGGTAASQYMSLGQVSAPETGVTNPVGVFKLFYGTNSTTPTEANELYRFEWGDRLGFVINKPNTAGFVTSIMGNVGIGTTSPTSRIHGVATLSAATGNETAYQLNYTTNKLTSGNDTGLLINQTDTASPGTSYLADFQVGGVSKTSINNTGTISTQGDIVAAGATSVVRLKGYTVATLPTGTQGDTAFVTDALAPTFLATIVGGGAVVSPVFYNGSSWVGY